MPSISCRRWCNSAGVAHCSGSAQRLPVPCDRSTTPFCSGAWGSFQWISRPRPSNHKARSGGQSPAEPHGPPLSTRRVAGKPQRAKTFRNSACTATGGTWSHLPRGENGRLQNGPATLIDDPQPTHALARLEADQFGGIDLPDVMGPGRPLGAAGGPAAGGSGAEARLPEPALEGALAGDGGARVAALEHDAEQAGSPARVRAAQVEDVVPQGR